MFLLFKPPHLWYYGDKVPVGLRMKSVTVGWVRCRCARWAELQALEAQGLAELFGGVGGGDVLFAPGVYTSGPV